MGSITSCIKKAGEFLHPEDKSALLKRAKELREEGRKADEAARMAVEERLGFVGHAIEEGATSTEQAHDAWRAARDTERARTDEMVSQARAGAEQSVAKWRDENDRPIRVEAKDVPLEAIAEANGFTSADQMLRAIMEAGDKQDVIDAMTDQRMLQRHGELIDPQSVAAAADDAVHNEARARFLATGLKILTKSQLPAKQIAKAAKLAAEAAIAAKRILDMKPRVYLNAESKSNRDAIANAAKDPAKAIEAQRAAILNNRLAKASQDALSEVDKGAKYLSTVTDSKSIDHEYRTQIEGLLERYELRPASGKAIEKRVALRKFLDSLEEQGLSPDIPDAIIDDARQINYRELTVEEFRGLVDAVKAIEHLGRLKNRLLTAKSQKEFTAIRDEIEASIIANSGGRSVTPRSAATEFGRIGEGLRKFWYAHNKSAMLARVMDGDKDGPLWEYLVRSANESGDMETAMRARVTKRAFEIIEPMMKRGQTRPQEFASIGGRSMTREQVIGMALNMGNAGNIQRMLGGEGWTVEQVRPVLATLTSADWQGVQKVWDLFEEFRPLIAAKELRVYGREMKFVDPQAFEVTGADGVTVTMRGGYYPIVYDPVATPRAQEQADAESARREMHAAYTTATTRHGFRKPRVDEVHDRPILYTLNGVYSGLNDVIHDLAWHEWLIDANKILRSDKIMKAMYSTYGPEAAQQLKTWVKDIATGDRQIRAAVEMALGRIRQGVSAAGLGFNLMNALIQPLGLTQSVVRVGGEWVSRGVGKFVASPIDATKEVHGKSTFMENRVRTRFRELNELRNTIEGQSKAKEFLGTYGYWLMMRAQQLVDVPTWLGAYEKSIHEGNAEDRAVALADQAVIDSQGSGMVKDLSAIERGGPAQKLFTVFYHFFNTALNLGVGKTMAANTPAKRAKLAVDYALLFVLPAVMAGMLKAAITPGDSGDFEDMESTFKTLAGWQLEYLMGLMVLVREASGAAKSALGLGEGYVRDYSGPAGLRLFADASQLGKQTGQVWAGGEFDDAFRKALINTLGDAFALPAAQINRTITGIQAINEGKTENPAAILFGYQEP